MNISFVKAAVQTIKRILIFAMLVSHIGNVFGQVINTNESSVKTFYPDTTEACDPEWIFSIVEIMPQYKDGLQQLEIDLNENLELDNKINGAVFISININCNNKLYGPQVLEGLNEHIDNKLIEQLEALQNWTSGSHRNKKVDCYKNLGFQIKKGRITITNK